MIIKKAVEQVIDSGIKPIILDLQRVVNFSSDVEGMPNAIPVVDQDFIFSAISEELGAIFGVCIILLSFNVFLIFIKTAIACKDDYYRLLCAGLAVTYGFQLFLTVGGAIKLIPSTGVTYPLISYGGSSLMSTIFMFFIVQGVRINEDKQ